VSGSVPALSAEELAGLRAVLAERAISAVILDYARGVDQRDYPAVRHCFHPDARIDYGVFAGGPDALIGWLERIQPQLDRSSHFFAPPRVQLDLSGGRAEVETSCIQVAVPPRDPRGAARRRISGLRYLDRFEQRAGVWRIAERRNVPDWTAQL
jgi:hypothetical protein